MRRTNIVFQNETLVRLAEEKSRTDGLSLSEYIQRLVSQDIGVPEKSESDTFSPNPQLNSHPTNQ